MGKIIRNGINYSSTTDAAKNINYDNSQSGLNATTAQKAIDELNRKIAAGGGGSSSNIVYLTQTEYDALPDDKLEDDIEYWITDAGVRGSAENVSYDASASGLDAKNVQEAVDKLAEGAGNKVEYLTQEEYDSLPEDKLTNNVEYRILDSGTPTTARNIGYDGSASGIDAINVQGAIDKVNESLGGLSFGYNSETGKYGYWKKEADTDVFVPFNGTSYEPSVVMFGYIYAFHDTVYIEMANFEKISITIIGTSENKIYLTNNIDTSDGYTEFDSGLRISRRSIIDIYPKDYPNYKYLGIVGTASDYRSYCIQCFGNTDSFTAFGNYYANESHHYVSIKDFNTMNIVTNVDEIYASNTVNMGANFNGDTTINLTTPNTIDLKDYQGTYKYIGISKNGNGKKAFHFILS